MKHVPPLLLSLGFCLALVAPTVLLAGDPVAVTPVAAAPPKGELTRYTFDQSKIFPGTTREYWVYVPRQYDASKPACVHVNQDGVQFNAPEVFDRLIAEGSMPVTIGIFVRPGEMKPKSKDALSRYNRSYEYDGLGDAYAAFSPGRASADDRTGAEA